MSTNNLRILYDNLADTATVTASSTAGGLSAANLQKDSKGLVWRSTGTTATITATWSALQTFSGVALPFCNLTGSATIRVRVYTDTAGTTLARDTGTVNAGAYIPTDVWGNWAGTPSGVAAYSFGGGSYARCWFTSTPGRRLVIDLSDSTNSSGYLEASRLVCGAYWSPTYNTNFGLQVGFVDTSEQTRSESGNFITTNNTVHKTLNFDLSYLTDADRAKMMSILRGNGLRRPLFVSVFPDDTDLVKEQNYQIYGKLTNLNSITHPLYTIYSTNLTIEEI